ncbi:structural protein P5 [Catenovulum sp. SM1970]|uniref:structural protein P5 n=1 Tax=Marinifaba aquimaris TaxID=2741323 RepID=UPI001571629E|nr:structural protein P5 [Marinifaba aquimaris]NTS77346.1 structural protein P5 [Marinifaba aquimaris]
MTTITLYKMMPRALRNNNPLNIRYSEQNAWRGEIPLAQNKQADNEFETFSNPVYGYRAAAILLRNYKSKYGLDTLEDIIARFAPPSENDTGAYIASVASQLRYEPDDYLTLDDEQMVSLLLAMHKHEAGRVYFGEELAQMAVKMINREQVA